MRQLTSLSVAVIALVGVLCAFTQPAAADTPVPADSMHVLRPGDVVRLRIWREPDLSGDFPVDERGVVTFPKIGQYTVTGGAADSLEATLVTAYQKYLRNPSIEVTLLRRINILGEVRNPGLHAVDPTMTIADAIALAGGMTPTGNANKVELIRDGSKLTAKLSTRTRIADSPVQSGDQLFVRERSWVSRNTGIVATGLSASVSLVIALFIR